MKRFKNWWNFIFNGVRLLAMQWYEIQVLVAKNKTLSDKLTRNTNKFLKETLRLHKKLSDLKNSTNAEHELIWSDIKKLLYRKDEKVNFKLELENIKEQLQYLKDVANPEFVSQLWQLEERIEKLEGKKAKPEGTVTIKG